MNNETSSPLCPSLLFPSLPLSIPLLSCFCLSLLHTLWISQWKEFLLVSNFFVKLVDIFDLWAYLWCCYLAERCKPSSAIFILVNGIISSTKPFFIVYPIPGSMCARLSGMFRHISKADLVCCGTIGMSFWVSYWVLTIFLSHSEE